MVDWADELKKKLENSDGVDDSVKEVVSQVSDDVSKNEERVEKLAREREDLRKRLMEKITIIKEGMDKGKALFDSKDF